MILSQKQPAPHSLFPPFGLQALRSRRDAICRNAFAGRVFIQSGALSLLSVSMGPSRSFYDCVFMVHSSFPSFSIPSLRHSFIINGLFCHILPCYGQVIKGAVLLINDRFMHIVLSVSLSRRAVLRQYNDHCWHVGYCNGGCAAVSPSRPQRSKHA